MVSLYGLEDLGFRVYGLGFEAQGLEFRIQGLRNLFPGMCLNIEVFIGRVQMEMETTVFCSGT